MKSYAPKHTIKEIYKNTYAITDSGFGQGKVYMYFLVGSRKALLVDSGYGLLDLKAVLGQITDKPIICVCTHGHVDHALGACQFDEAYLHSKDFEVYEQHTKPDFIKIIGAKGLLMSPPKSMLNNPSYQEIIKKMAEKQYAPLSMLDKIESFDLGERIVGWTHIPGHTQGSVALVDKSNNTVFDGDAGAPGAWLFLEESSSLPEYLDTLNDYHDFMLTNNIANRYVGHSGKAIGIKHLKQIINCVETAIAKPRKGIKIKSILGNPRIVFAGGSLLFCKR
ncbi:MAG: MBL fold metallo-hydrolase [Lachnospiraceae bacterium]|nr:MBL fold metallo-hydrolase [Lachnospiraceae bacterium]